MPFLAYRGKLFGIPLFIVEEVDEGKAVTSSVRSLFGHGRNYPFKFHVCSWTSDKPVIVDARNGIVCRFEKL